MKRRFGTEKKRDVMLRKGKGEGEKAACPVYVPETGQGTRKNSLQEKKKVKKGGLREGRRKTKADQKSALSLRTRTFLFLKGKLVVHKWEENFRSKKK